MWCVCIYSAWCFCVFSFVLINFRNSTIDCFDQCQDAENKYVFFNHYGIDVFAQVFLFLSNMNVHRDHAWTNQSLPPCPKPGFVVPENIQLRIQLIRELRLNRLKAAKFSSSHIPKKKSLHKNMSVQRPS